MKRFAALIAALAGAIFCSLAALGATEAVCITAGCAVFKGTSVLGLDLYWIGAAFFLSVAALLALSSRRPALARLSVWLVMAGLAADALLLALQAVSLSCLNCLIFAAMLGIVAALLLPGPPMLGRTLVIWAVLFVAAVAGLLRDGLSPIAIYGGEDATIKVFFSPSCPACREELGSLASRPELHGHLALYPIARNEDDLRGILRLRDVLDQGGGLAAAVEACFAKPKPDEPEPDPSGSWGLRLISFRNTVFLARAGAASIPYVLTSSPALLQAAPPQGEERPEAPGRPAPNADARPKPAPDAKPDEGCGYTQDNTCPDEPEAEAIPDLFGPGPLQSPAQ